jgi:hypothetical protein
MLFLRIQCINIVNSNEETLNISRHNPTFLQDEWTLMDPQEALHYYSGNEICRIFSHRRLSWCNDEFPDYLRSCSMLHSKCQNTHGYLYKHKSTKPWPESRNILDVIKLLLKNDRYIITLVGDSLTHQHFQDLKCQLLRYGLNLQFANDTYLKIDNPFYLKHQGASKASKYPLLQHRHPYIYVFRFSSEKWKDCVSQLQTHFDSYGPKSMLIIFNSGLWYNQHIEGHVESYQSDLRSFFQFFIDEAISKYHQIVMFRETSAQHFQTSNGLFQTYESDPIIIHPRLDMIKELMNKVFFKDSTSQYGNLTHFPIEKIEKKCFHQIKQHCPPLSDEKSYIENNWRNEIAKNILKEFDPMHEKIPILSFFRLTASRYDIHLDCEDCTHFCSSPMLWLPLWHQIAFELIKYF